MNKKAICKAIIYRLREMKALLPVFPALVDPTKDYVDVHRRQTLDHDLGKVILAAKAYGDLRPGDMKDYQPAQVVTLDWARQMVVQQLTTAYVTNTSLSKVNGELRLDLAQCRDLIELLIEAGNVSTPDELLDKLKGQSTPWVRKMGE